MPIDPRPCGERSTSMRHGSASAPTSTKLVVLLITRTTVRVNSDRFGFEEKNQVRRRASYVVRRAESASSGSLESDWLAVGVFPHHDVDVLHAPFPRDLMCRVEHVEP
jgi:hypothetical protein